MYYQFPFLWILCENLLTSFQNIEKAQKEVERLEAEESTSPATFSPATNGHGDNKATASVDEGGSVANEIKLADAAVADAAADLKEASLEDKA